MTGAAASFGPLRTSAASFSVITPICCNSASLVSTVCGLWMNSRAMYARIFRRMNMAFVQR